MSLPGFSVRRPVFITMVTLIVVLLGLVSLRQLAIPAFCLRDSDSIGYSMAVAC